MSDIGTHLGCNITKDMLVRFLKKLRYSYRRIRKVLKTSPDPAEYDAKLKELLQLISLEKGNFLKIYFADESGFTRYPMSHMVGKVKTNHWVFRPLVGNGGMFLVL